MTKKFVELTYRHISLCHLYVRRSMLYRLEIKLCEVRLEYSFALKTLPITNNLKIAKCGISNVYVNL